MGDWQTILASQVKCAQIFAPQNEKKQARNPNTDKGSALSGAVFARAFVRSSAGPPTRGDSPTGVGAWEGCSLQLSSSLEDNTSRTLATPAMAGHEKLQALELLAGYDWAEIAMTKVLAKRLPTIIQSALRNAVKKELGASPRIRIRSIRNVPLRLTTENPHRWRNIIATAGLALREFEGCCNRTRLQLSEVLIFAPDGTSPPRADRRGPRDETSDRPAAASC